MLDNYNKVETSPDFQTFEFIRTGLRGDITKVLRYSELVGNCKLYIMKTKETSEKKKLPKNFRVKKALTDQYADQPLFKEKIERANHILKTIGLPNADNKPLHKQRS